MRYAVVSDIHANWQAWTAVRDDIAIQDVDCTLCLGDVVGYGPSPARVLEDVYAHCENFVLGNHDAVVCGKIDPHLFNDRARFAIDWTCDRLGDDVARFFSDVPMTMTNDSLLCVHAEAAQPSRWGYIFETEEARASFEAVDADLIFVGHTHQPTVCSYADGRLSGGPAAGPIGLDSGYRYLCNVGSVGDPRDGKPTASYCIYDSDARVVEFRRLVFNYAAFRQELDASRLPSRPMFLDCIEQVSAARTQKTELVDMALPDTREMPAVSVVRSKSARIRIKRRTKARRSSPARKKVAAAKGRNKRFYVAAALALAIVGLIAAIMVASKKPQPQTVARQALTAGTSGQSVGQLHAHQPQPQTVARQALTAGTSGQSVGQLHAHQPQPQTVARRALTAGTSGQSVGQLHARHAVIHGTGLTYEAQNDRQCIGIWSNPAAWVSWQVEVDKPGVYKISITQAMEGGAGSEYDVIVGDSILSGVVKDTGDWAKLETIELGNVNLPKTGKVKVAFKPTKKKSMWIVNLRSVNLTPLSK